MKTLILILSLFGAIQCSTFSKKPAEEKLYVESQKGDEFDIKLKGPKDGDFSVTLKTEDSKQFLIITNPKTGSKWQMSYRDFKIFTIGYKNWRLVENARPVITEIKEDGDWISFTFNYYKETSEIPSARSSILSGVVSINKKYIRTSKDANSKYWIYGLGAYSVIITTILFIIVL